MEGVVVRSIERRAFRDVGGLAGNRVISAARIATAGPCRIDVDVVGVTDGASLYISSLDVEILGDFALQRYVERLNITAPIVQRIRGCGDICRQEN